MNRTATIFLSLLFLFTISIDSHSAEKKPVASLTMEQIANATYVDAEEKDTFKLQDGYCEKYLEGMLYLRVYLTKWVGFGDLNQDGAIDGVAIYIWNGGGSGIFYEMATLLNIKGKPVHIYSTILGDRVRINSLEIHGDTVQLEMITHGKGEGACCPTLPVTLHYRLQDDKLMEQTDYLGNYEGKATLLNGVRMNIKMSIKSDYTVKMTVKYSDRSAVEHKTGKWYVGGDGSLVVDFIKSSGWPSSNQLWFRFLNSKLASMLYMEDIYGGEDLVFEKIDQ